MKDFSFLSSAPVCLEISRDILRAARESSRVELPLEREADGKLTAACRERIISGLRAFVNKKSFQPRARAYCAIAAAGVSLRRLTLPVTSGENFEQVLRLQIEAEFPLAPDELAWGHLPLAGSGTAAKQEVLVAALKRDKQHAVGKLSDPVKTAFRRLWIARRRYRIDAQDAIFPGYVNIAPIG